MGWFRALIVMTSGWKPHPDWLLQELHMSTCMKPKPLFFMGKRVNEYGSGENNWYDFLTRPLTVNAARSLQPAKLLLLSFNSARHSFSELKLDSRLSWNLSNVILFQFDLVNELSPSSTWDHCKTELSWILPCLSLVWESHEPSSSSSPAQLNWANLACKLAGFVNGPNTHCMPAETTLLCSRLRDKEYAFSWRNIVVGHLTSGSWRSGTWRCSWATPAQPRPALG